MVGKIADGRRVTPDATPHRCAPDGCQHRDGSISGMKYTIP